MNEPADRIPVIVGVGQVNDRPVDIAESLDSGELMVAALRVADEDGGGGWLRRLEALSVVDQISFRDLNPLVDRVAEALGASPRICEQTPIPTGDSPIRLLHDAANRIGRGQIAVAAIVGGEALRTAARRASESAGDAAPRIDASREMSAKSAGTSYRGRHGLVAPVDVYPLYENAGRAAYGQTLAEGQYESGVLWSAMSDVACANPGAWIRKRAEVEEIVTPSIANRPISFPYNKLMVANSSVNQGAGFIVATLAEALAMGVPEERLIYVGRGAAAHECPDPLERDRFDRSPSMAVSLETTLRLNGLAIEDIDAVELYSCFPCVPKMARRVIGLPADAPTTVFGGLTFGGGPIGNYMSHAVVSMVHQLRERGVNGLLFANGGFATENHSIVLTRRSLPAGTFPESYDYQGEANAARGAAPPIVEDYIGPATVETYTVLYDRAGGARFGVVVARSPDGGRALARVPGSDADGIAFLTDGLREPIGSLGEITAGEDGIATWLRVGGQ